MSHLSDNLKTIRKVWGKNQSEFASLFIGIGEANQKSYERKKPSIPDIVYINRLSEITGINQKELMETAITPDDVPAKPILYGEEKTEKSNSTKKEPTLDAIAYSLKTLTDSHKILIETHRDVILTNRRFELLLEINLGASAEVSRLLMEQGVAQPGPVAYIPGSLDKQEIGSKMNEKV